MPLGEICSLLRGEHVRLSSFKSIDIYQIRSLIKASQSGFQLTPLFSYICSIEEAEEDEEDEEDTVDRWFLAEIDMNR